MWVIIDFLFFSEQGKDTDYRETGPKNCINKWLFPGKAPLAASESNCDKSQEENG
jgi:hypothetical protein